MRCKRILKEIAEHVLLFFIMGMVYFTIEGLWRIPQGGYANIAMLPVGGTTAVLIGRINQRKRFFSQKIWVQGVIGTIITLLVELAAGCLLNLHMGLGLWDYSHMWGNLWGQICIQFAIAWYIIMPLAIWLDDTLRYLLFKEGEYYPLWSIYLEFITGR